MEAGPDDARDGRADDGLLHRRTAPERVLAQGARVPALRARLREVRQGDASRAERLDALERALTRSYYLGRFPEYVALIAEVPAR